MFARKMKSLLASISNNRQRKVLSNPHSRSHTGNILTLRDRVLLKAQRSQAILILIAVASTCGIIASWVAFQLGVDGNSLLLVDSFINQVCIYLMLPLRFVSLSILVRDSQMWCWVCVYLQLGV